MLIRVTHNDSLNSSKFKFDFCPKTRLKNNKFVLKIIKSFGYSTLINIIPVLVEYFNSSIIFLGISNELKLQLIESVRSQINLLFLKTISSGLDSKRLSLPILLL